MKLLGSKKESRHLQSLPDGSRKIILPEPNADFLKLFLH
jgi:hypothetical protein